MNDEEKINSLIELVKSSVEKVYDEKDCLLRREGMERAAVGRVFYYMQDTIYKDVKYSDFRKFNLDVEYNKNGKDVKFLPSWPKGAIPDLIMHERMNNDNNILAIEFKVSKGNIEKDYKKLMELTECAYDYKFFLGVSVFMKKDCAEYKFFNKGQEFCLN